MRAILDSEKIHYVPWPPARCAACGDWMPAPPLDGEVVFCKECTACARRDPLFEMYVDLGGGD
jgi:hypothetical protein